MSKRKIKKKIEEYAMEIRNGVDKKKKIRKIKINCK